MSMDCDCPSLCLVSATKIVKIQNKCAKRKHFLWKKTPSMKPNEQYEQLNSFVCEQRK